MNAFSYVTARSVESAVELVREDGQYFAGGMDLLGEIKESIATPKLLVNVKALPGTTGITATSPTWTIGANVTLATLAAHPAIRRALPALAQAAAAVGSPQIRHVATVGGNLAQHSRCWYYRHRDVECRKKGGTTCFARQGENKFHALFTGCMCLSPLVSNLAIALAALDARVIVQRGRQAEPLTLAQFYEAAWRTPTAHNSLRPGELILRVEVPLHAAVVSTYLQAAEKSDFDWALVSCAVSARVSGGTLSGARIVLGSVASIPWQSDEANALLEGQVFSDELAGRAADVLLREARPFDDNGYKVPIARTLVRRALGRLVT